MNIQSTIAIYFRYYLLMYDLRAYSLNSDIFIS